MLAPCADAATVRILVAAGANRGLPGELDLKYAERDAGRYARVLTADHRIVVKGATARELKGAIAKAAGLARKHRREDVTFFFYYSGHGDSDDLHLMGERLPLSALETALATVPAQLRVTVIDACRTERDIRRKGLVRGQFAIRMEAPPGIKGVVAVNSSGVGEASQESEELQGAVFTHYLLTALRGAADYDKDGRISLNEAFKYAARQTTRRSAEGTANVMHPTRAVDIEGAGELILTRTRPDNARIILPKGADAHYLVYQRPSGALMAEVWSDPTRPTTLPVPAGRYLVHRRTAGQSGAYAFKVTTRATETAKAERFYEFPIRVLKEKGGQLQIWHQRVHAGYGAMVTDATAFAQRVRARYGFGIAWWSISASVDLGRTARNDAAYAVTEQWVGGDLLAQFNVVGGLDLSGGVAWRYVSQELERLDVDTLAQTGVPVSLDRAGAAAGPTVGVGYTFLLKYPWFVRTDLSAAGFVRREAEALAFRLEGSLELSVGAEF